MKTIVPDYYCDFHCIADKCSHTCCSGWEVEIDDESAARFRAIPDIAAFIEETDTVHFRLLSGERCPFLEPSGLCRLISLYGEGILCQICRDHPRFRNFWSDRVELGIGLVCEEAARLILGREKPMKLIVLSDDGKNEALPEDEAWLMSVREEMMAEIADTGPFARLMEYLIYRHLPDALYDDRLEARKEFIRRSFHDITEMWSETDGGFDSMVECARIWSYEVEYDGDELNSRISECE